MAGVITREDVIRSLDSIGIESESVRNTALLIYAAIRKWEGRSQLAQTLLRYAEEARRQGMLDTALAPILISAVSICMERQDPMCGDVEKARHFITIHVSRMPPKQRLREYKLSRKDRKRIVNAWRRYRERTSPQPKKGILTKLKDALIKRG